MKRREDRHQDSDTRHPFAHAVLAFAHAAARTPESLLLLRLRLRMRTMWIILASARYVSHLIIAHDTIWALLGARQRNDSKKCRQRCLGAGAGLRTIWALLGPSQKMQKFTRVRLSRVAPRGRRTTLFGTSIPRTTCFGLFLGPDNK